MRGRKRIGISLTASCLLGLAAFASSGAPGGAAAVISHGVRLASQGPAISSGPSATWSSSNWSGYAETGTFTSISGSWTVPTAAAGAVTTTRSRFGFGGGSTSSWYSSAWLGIDGFNNSNLIQTGTEQDYYGGAAHYSAWWEILPASETVISDPVSAGDLMTAMITKTPTTISVGGGGFFGRGRTTTEYEWTITLADKTRGWTFTTTQAYNGAGTSAEWIVEAPEVNGSVASLANYAFPTAAGAGGDFNSAKVATTLGGPLAGAGLSYSADAGTLVQNNAQVSTPGAPDAAATAFNSLYGATAPAAPTS
jgi:Peptidase A4 family